MSCASWMGRTLLFRVVSGTTLLGVSSKHNLNDENVNISDLWDFGTIFLLKYGMSDEAGGFFANMSQNKPGAQAAGQTPSPHPPTEASSIGKIHPFSKMAVNCEPVMGF